MRPESADTAPALSLSIVHKVTFSTFELEPASARHCLDLARQIFHGRFHGSAALALNSVVLNPVDHALLSSIDTAQLSHISADTHRDMKSLTDFNAELVPSSIQDPDAEIGWLSNVINSPAVALLALAIIGMAAVARRSPMPVPAETIA